MIKLEEVCQRLAFLERDEREKGVAGQGEIEGSVGTSVPVSIFLPGGGVAFVVIAILDAPVVAGGLGGTHFVIAAKTGEENAGMAFFAQRIFLFAPLAMDAHGGASARQTGIDRRDGFDKGFAGVDAPVRAFATQVKKGEPSRACPAPSRRLEVFSLVPMR